MKTLQFKKAISFGWKTTTSNFWFFFQLMVIAFVATQVFPSIVGAIIPDNSREAGVVLLSLFITIISIFISMFVRLSLATISLHAVDKKPLVLKDFFEFNSLKFWSFVGASVVLGLCVGFGVILFIVPGIMIAVAWSMYNYVIIDKDMHSREALRESARITKGYRWQLFGFIILLGLINMAGALLLGIGLLWTIPTTMIAMAHMYRQLLV